MGGVINGKGGGLIIIYYINNDNTPNFNLKNEMLYLLYFNLQFISHLLDIKALHGDLHRTYNMHDAIYNCKVVEKALGMVLNRYLRYVLNMFNQSYNHVL